MEMDRASTKRHAEENESQSKPSKKQSKITDIFRSVVPLPSPAINEIRDERKVAKIMYKVDVDVVVNIGDGNAKTYLFYAFANPETIGIDSNTETSATTLSLAAATSPTSTQTEHQVAVAVSVSVHSKYLSSFCFLLS